ncbi:MAG: hypothetical protein JW928_01970 [Candidatus Aureabacteria bacterium]|nr:hypothetical protein [Candidatus Auribacterota bacterium]
MKRFKSAEKLSLLAALFLCFFSFASAFPAEMLISMDFEDVEIKMLIKTMSEILEKNFIISNQVEGRVSLSAPKNVTKEEALSMLRAILLIHGYALIEKPEAFEVVSAENAKTVQDQVSFGRSLPEDITSSNSYITHLVKLEYADAEEVKNVLTPLLSKGGYLGIVPENNAVIMTGDIESLKKILTLINQIDRQHSALGRDALQVVKCHNISSSQAAEMLDKLYASKLRMEGRSEGQNFPSFISHEESNSLLISANAGDMEKLKDVLATIDIPKKQVLVKAVVAEITEQTAKEIGFDILSTGGVLYATEKGFTKISEAGMTSALLSGADAKGTAFTYAEGTQTISGTTIPDISWVINLSQKHSGIDILSTPKLLTADNEDAEIIVGKNLAFLKDSQVTPQGGTVKTFDFKDVGLKLKIKPRIGSDDIISLIIDQQLEEVLGSSFEGGVETSKRSITTTVILKDGSLAVIGGLTADSKNKIDQEPPVLSKIPLISWLFKRHSENTEKKNLLLFITAQIVKSPEDMDTLARKETTKDILSVQE